MLKLYNTLTRKKEIFRINQKGKGFPWKTSWYQLKDTMLLKLKGNTLKQLIKLGIKKAGNLNKLCKILNLSYPSFLYALRGQCELVSVNKLRKLTFYLKINYDNLNDNISEIRRGNIASIKNPKFPFNLATKEGAIVLGNIVSDGSIYIDKKAQNIKRTKYSAGTKEEADRFIKNINEIFGHVHFQKEKIRNSIYLKIGSSVIGDSLVKVGAPVGNKTRLDPPLPWLIKNASDNLKINYLRAVFDDEGSIGTIGSPFVTLSRSVYINNHLSHYQKEVLQKIKPFCKERKFPTGHIIKSIQIKKAVFLAPLTKNLLLNIAPRVLLDESNLLSNLGIENRIRNSVLSFTQKGNVSLTSELRILRKKSLLEFYKKINFGISLKKMKLKNTLSNKTWL